MAIEELKSLIEDLRTRVNNSTPDRRDVLRNTEWGRRRAELAADVRGFPRRQFGAEDFADVRERFASAKNARGERILDAVDLVRLDQAYETYVREVLVISAAVPKELEALIRRRKTEFEALDLDAFLRILNEEVMQPMNRLDGRFRKVLNCLVAGMVNGHEVFPADQTLRLRMWAHLLMVGQRCMLQTNDPREFAFVAEIRKLYAATRWDMLRFALLKHEGAHNLQSRAAFECYEMAQAGNDTGWRRIVGCGVGQVTAGRRLATVFQCDLSDTPSVLHGRTVGEIMQEGIEALRLQGADVEADIDETTILTAHANHGRMDEAIEGVSRLRQSQAQWGGRCGALEGLLLTVESRALTNASKGKDKGLLRAAGNKIAELRKLQQETGRRLVGADNGVYISTLEKLSMNVLGTVEHLSA